MRTTIICAFALVLLSGCGGKTTVADHLDGLAASGTTYRHNTLPSPARRAELNPVSSSDPTPGQTLAERLHKNEHGRALLDAGQTAVPELIALLGDENRRTLAAVFLGEAGGPEAAGALLHQWRELRPKRLKKNVYVHLSDPAKPGSRSLRAGFHYEGVEGAFYGELLFALSYCGRPESAAIASDTRAAMKRCESRQAAGEVFVAESQGEPSDEHPHGTTVRWSDGEVETCDEGLELLAMIGAPEATELFVRALHSPVRSFRWTALQNASYLGTAVKPLVASIWQLLDDPDLADLAASALTDITRGPRSPQPPEGEAWDAWRARTEKALQDLGYPTR